jgi:hypothetical protein
MARKVFQSAIVPAAVYNPSGNVTIGAITSLNTVTITIGANGDGLPRNFSPNRQTFAIFTAGLPVGVTASVAVVAGNSPTSGATGAAWYYATINLYNSTSGTLTPSAQQVQLFQI